jgi:hypothetical protein
LKHEEVKELGTAVRLAYLISKPAATRTTNEASELYTRWLTSIDTDFQNASAKVDHLEIEEQDIRMAPRITWRKS